MIIARRIKMTLLCTLILTSSAPSSCAQKIQPSRIVGLQYPWLANLARVQGKVELYATVAEDGQVSEISSVSGHQLLKDSAKASLSRWVFSGCGKNAAPCRVKVIFEFILSGECDQDQCPTDFVVDLPDFVTVTTKAAGPIID